jgi:hypothetical protein
LYSAERRRQYFTLGEICSSKFDSIEKKGQVIGYLSSQTPKHPSSIQNIWKATYVKLVKTQKVSYRRKSDQ